MLVSFLLIILFGYLGYRIFNYFHIPGGAVTGALVTVALISSQGFQWAEMPSELMTFFQVIIGIVIGSKFSKEKLDTLKSLLIPGILTSIWMILFSFVIAFILVRMTGIEIGVALYGSVPGGLTEMGLIALAHNLSVPMVTIFQFVRLVSVNMSVTYIASRCYQNHDSNECIPGPLKKKERKREKLENQTGIKDILIVLLVGVIGGFTARFLNIPVAGILGAMFSVGTLRIMGISLKELPSRYLLSAQIVLGGYLGTTFTPDMFQSLKSLFFPIIFFSLIIVLNGLLIGYFLYRYLKWDLITSLLAAAAGGTTIMTMTALELNADPIKVSILHSIRIAIILLTMPLMIEYVLR